MKINITPDLARKLIVQQFPEFSYLYITDVDKQRHDNRTYRLGDHMLILMPTATLCIRHLLKLIFIEEVLGKMQMSTAEYSIYLRSASKF